MNWKKEFEWKQERVWQLPDETSFDRQTIKFIKDFISTGIIEKLIADIPDELIDFSIPETPTFDTTQLKQQLKDKWL